MDNEKKSKSTKNEQWHRWFGDLFKISLTPLGIDVKTDFPVMTDPPKADVVIIHKNKKDWTHEQLQFLPDGIRNSKAEHIILEFKYTQSINEDAFFQTAGYRIFYKFSHKLKNENIQTFLISSKTPEQATLKEYGYTLEEPRGVFTSQYPLLKRIPLISLNDIENKPYNALIKLFASKKKARIAAIAALGSLIKFMPSKLKSYILSFHKLLFGTGGDEMDCQEELTSEELTEVSRIFDKFVLAILPPEEILANFKPEQRMKGLKPEQRLKGLKPEQRLKGLKPEQIKAYLKKISKNE